MSRWALPSRPEIVGKGFAKILKLSDIQTLPFPPVFQQTCKHRIMTLLALAKGTCIITESLRTALCWRPFSGADITIEAITLLFAASPALRGRRSSHQIFVVAPRFLLWLVFVPREK